MRLLSVDGKYTHQLYQIYGNRTQIFLGNRWLPINWLARAPYLSRLKSLKIEPTIDGYLRCPLYDDQIDEVINLLKGVL